MTVGKDAVERTTHSSYRRKLPMPKSYVFLMGVGAGVGVALLLGLIYVLLTTAASSALNPPPKLWVETASTSDGGTQLLEETPGNQPVLPRPAEALVYTSTSTVQTEMSHPADIMGFTEPKVVPTEAETETAAEPLDDGMLVGEEGPPTPDLVVVEGEIQPNQFMANMLVAAGLSDGEADRTVRALAHHFNPTKSRPGDRYRIDLLVGGELGRFEYQPAPDKIYYVARDINGTLTGHRLHVELKREVVEVAGKIEHSLWMAFEQSGESPALAADLTEAFRFDIDFFHETRKGDKFRFFVEKYSHRGELVRYGQIYAAEYVGTGGSPIGTKRLYWYRNPQTRTRGFYDEVGRAAQRAFLRSPLKYTRISSGFGFRRHPILGRRHFHGGIDYAAPTGTPVRAVASGTVIAAGRAGPNGNMVRIRHSGGYESFYLHLSRILVRKNARVGQSTIVGKVGSTGRSTGPHLDFRLKKNGRYLNPSKNVAPRTKRIPARDKTAFKKKIAPWIKRLMTAKQSASSEIATKTQ
ncbi:MAG: M23 family metallopeptidase [Myxococcales bacterium]|nr:M23 family metallopeptidase [Myxococcales bacterium]